MLVVVTITIIEIKLSITHNVFKESRKRLRTKLISIKIRSLAD